MTPLQAIKLHCAECIGEGTAKICTSKECKLFPFRMGKNTIVPKRVLTEEQRAKLVEQLRRNKVDQTTQL